MYQYLCINLHINLSIYIYTRNIYLLIYKALTLTSFVCKWHTGYSDSTFDPNKAIVEHTLFVRQTLIV